MKRLLFIITILGSVFFTSCEKNELPALENQSIKSDKGILCKGCGDWDIVTPASEPSKFRGVNPDTIRVIPQSLTPLSSIK
ncbi:MAG: hypothetical protein WC380_02690 [Pedobacter sp.]|jgi:hypothetical protein